MIHPTVHGNGTSRESLQEQYEVARSSVYKALRVVEAAGPNARDYYVQGDDAYRTAEREHLARVKRLREVHEELTELLEKLYEDDLRGVRWKRWP